MRGLCSLVLSLTAATLFQAPAGAVGESGARYEVLLFSRAPDLPPSLAKEAIGLAVEHSNRPEIGPSLLYVETDAKGVAIVRKADRGDAVRMVYADIGPRVAAGPDTAVPVGSGAVRTYYLFAHLNPAPGQDVQFNAFYDGTHLPDVLRVPGMVWGQRARLVSAEPDSIGAPAYVAIYQFRSADLEATVAEVDRRLKTGVTHAFPAGTVGKGALVFYAAPAPEHP
jgi:hypothetical protein